MAASPDQLALLFEGAPRFIDRLRASDGESIDTLLERAEHVALAMPEEEQIELLNAHPRIGAAPGAVSEMSYREQGYDRDPGTADLRARLDWLNDAYEQRFGFRFVVHVAGRSRAEIADLMQQHLRGERVAEKQRGLRDVVAIARDRASRLGIAQEETRR